MANQTKPKIEIVDIDKLNFDEGNPRVHPKDNLDLLEHSFRELGAARSVVLDEHNTILAGNGATQGAIKAGKQKVLIIDVDGEQLVAVRRKNLTEAQKNELKLIDNRSAETSEWDYRVLQELLKDQTPEQAKDLGWNEKELTDLLSGVFTDRTFGGDEGTSDATEQTEEETVEPQDYGQFAVPVTASQEHIIRRGIKKAKEQYDITHSGEALTNIVTEWLNGTDSKEASA